MHNVRPTIHWQVSAHLEVNSQLPQVSGALITERTTAHSCVPASSSPLTYLSLTSQSDCSLSCPTPSPSEPGEDGNIAAIAGGIIVAIVLVVVIGIGIVIVVVM